MEYSGANTRGKGEIKEISPPEVHFKRHLILSQFYFRSMIYGLIMYGKQP